MLAAAAGVVLLSGSLHAQPAHPPQPAHPRGAAVTFPRGVEAAARTISAERARRCITALASDGMLGRNTPSPELDSAGAYLAARFRAAGVEPVGGTYFHEYVIEQPDLDGKPKLTIGSSAQQLATNFMPYDFTGVGNVSGGLVFAGFGITRPGFDEYAGLDVRGKVVVAIEGWPQGRATLRMFSREKMRLAARNGAVAILLVRNPLRSERLTPIPSPWHSLPSGSPQRDLWSLDGTPRTAPIPAMSIDQDAFAAALAMPADSIRRLIGRIDSTAHPESRPLAATAGLSVALAYTKRTVRNVVGIVRGRTQPNEYVAVGAHYDHIGHGRGTDRDTIFNGADDNASGTTGMMLAAESFAALSMKDRPARSLLFIAFSGEERGLFGSRAWVAHPLVPNDSVVAMLNMDMIGRNHRDSLSVGGRDRSDGLATLLEQANRPERMKLGYDLDAFFFRSDQASFAMHGIPVLFLSSGLHPDYHRPSDEIAKIDLRKLARIARVCYRTAWLAADSERRYRYLAPESEANPYDD